MPWDTIHLWVRRLFIPILLAIPFFTDRYVQYVLNLIMIYVVVGIGLNFLLGYAGQFAFAHAALMGIGAYACALLMSRLAFPFWIALPMAGVAAMLVGSLVALPAMRMKRVYLALVTLAFAELIQWILIHWKTVTLGTDGVSLPPTQLFGYKLTGDHPMAYVILFVAATLYVLGQRVVTSRFGRALVALRENEIVAQCSGINVTKTKLYVFALSSFYAGIGGGLFALALGFIVPDGFGLFQLVVHFSLVVIGGLISMYGSVIGAVVLTALPELLRDFQWLQEIIYGFTLVIFILFMPDGIAGLGKRKGWLPREILVRNWRDLEQRQRSHASQEGRK